MRRSVKIVSDQWTVHVPTGSGYDREVFCDHVLEAVQRHGRAHLECPGGTVSLERVPSRRRPEACTSCRKRERSVVGTDGADRLCLNCVWRWSIRPVDQPVDRPAAGVL